MATASFIIGIIGNVLSILVFASPIGTFKRIVSKRSVENFKAVPYVCTLLSTSLWSYYGIIKPGGLLILTVNAAGAFMEAIYVLLFLIFSTKEARIKLLKLVLPLNVGLFGSIVLVTYLAIRVSNVRLLVIGILCTCLTIGMYASPLVAMRTVISTKSVEYMPFFLSFFLFLNAGIWGIYALLVKDIFIGVPNAVGFVLGMMQLVIYFLYKNKSKVSRKESEVQQTNIEMQTSNKEDEETDKEGKPDNVQKPWNINRYSIKRQKSAKLLGKSYSSSNYELRSETTLSPDIGNLPSGQ